MDRNQKKKKDWDEGKWGCVDLPSWNLGQCLLEISKPPWHGQVSSWGKVTSPLLEPIRYSCGAEIMNPAIRRSQCALWGSQCHMGICGSYAKCPLAPGVRTADTAKSLRWWPTLVNQGGWPEAVFVPCLCWENHPRHFRNRYVGCRDQDPETRPDELLLSLLGWSSPWPRQMLRPPVKTNSVCWERRNRMTQNRPINRVLKNLSYAQWTGFHILFLITLTPSQNEGLWTRWGQLHDRINFIFLRISFCSSVL